MAWLRIRGFMNMNMELCPFLREISLIIWFEKKTLVLVRKLYSEKNPTLLTKVCHWKEDSYIQNHSVQHRESPSSYAILFPAKLYQHAASRRGSKTWGQVNALAAIDDSRTLTHTHTHTHTHTWLIIWLDLGKKAHDPAAVYPIDSRCKDDSCPVPASCVTISNTGLLFNSEIGLDPGIKCWKRTHLKSLILESHW